MKCDVLEHDVIKYHMREIKNMESSRIHSNVRQETVEYSRSHCSTGLI